MKSQSPVQPSRYHPISVTLHWLTIILMFGAAALAPEGEQGRSSAPYVHAIMGGLLAFVLILRLVLRFAVKQPTKASAGNAFFDLIGALTQWGLYFFAFLVLAGGAVIAMQRNLIGAMLGSGALQELSRNAASPIHEMGWSLAVMLILLHVGAALYHQFIIKDNLFQRMWYGK